MPVSGRLLERQQLASERRAAAGPITRARPGSSACCSTPAPAPASPRSRCGPRCRTTSRSRPVPKATLALLRGVEDILDAPLPLADLPEEARAWERGVDELAQQDSEVAEYVRTLEEAKDAMDLPEASGDAIAREFERYFRRRGGTENPAN